MSWASTTLFGRSVRCALKGLDQPKGRNRATSMTTTTMPTTATTAAVITRAGPGSRAERLVSTGRDLPAPGADQATGSGGDGAAGADAWGTGGRRSAIQAFISFTAATLASSLGSSIQPWTFSGYTVNCVS